jgi:hypothetical protein
MPYPTVAAPITQEPYVAIPMTPVKSNQVAAVGYDAETSTLAVTFTRGAGAIYHYPNVDAKLHADFIGAESIGKFFGKSIQGLPFKKFPALATKPAETAPAA